MAILSATGHPIHLVFDSTVGCNLQVQPVLCINAECVISAIVKAY